MLNVYELCAFLAAAETENFSEAAKRLHLSQSAVSLQIQSLERQLGTRLFHRIGRSVTLTEAGRALIPLARDIVNRTRHAEETIRGLKGLVLGELVVGCSTTVGKYILPRLIARFRETYPHVTARIYVSERQTVIDKLLHQVIDLAVTSTPTHHNDLECYNLLMDRIVLIVPRDHPWCQQRQIHPQDLLKADIILREGTAVSQQLLEEKLREYGITRDQLRVVMELESEEAIATAVEEGIGVSFVSWSVAWRGISMGLIRLIQVGDLNLERPIYLVRNRHRPETIALTRFLEFIRTPECAPLLRVPYAEWAEYVEERREASVAASEVHNRNGAARKSAG